jgi:hypothetical protein
LTNTGADAVQDNHNHPVARVSLLSELIVRPVAVAEEARFQALMQAHHYLGALPKIGHTLWYVAT